ncbi:nmrA-like family domain-containing protein 1 isoform X2 [Symsagittifera roscoffensis]|uniref:nmrA-like family domain-containing protein 1 isoform X2 n=1 Tax=Symsagittifera roscoffensis TaxID=84072 RepID=UPI00307B7D8E
MPTQRRMTAATDSTEGRREGSNDSKKSVAVFTVNNEVGFRVAMGLSSHYRVKAVILSDGGDDSRSESLKENGVEVHIADEFNKETVFNILHGCYACFLATKTVFTEPNFQQNEIERGILVVEQCKAANISHLIHLTHVTVEFSIGILARQNDAKEFIERQIRKLAIPSTGLILPVPYEVLFTVHKPVRYSGHKYFLKIPMGETAFDGISLEHVGEIVGGILAQGPKAFGKDYAVSAGKLTVEEMASIMSRQLHPADIRDAKMTVNELRQQGAETPGSEDIANMYEFMSRMDLRHNIDLTRSLCPSLLSFDQWVSKQRDQFKHILTQNK